MNRIEKRDGFQNEYLFVLPQQFLEQYEQDLLFAPMQVTDIGFFPVAHHHYRQRPDGCATGVLLYCHAGRGFVSQGGGQGKALQVGQAILINANSPHCYGADDNQPWSVYWMHLRGPMLVSYLQMSNLTEPVMVPDIMAEGLVYDFHRCFELLKTPYQRQEYFLLCQIAGQMLALLACAEKHTQLQLTPKGDQAIETCIGYMKAHLSEHLTRQQLARACGFSASRLNTLFKQSTGYSPIEYFLRMKLHAASKKLYFSACSVREVAADYGWEDPYYFSRLFKQTMGVSPTEYRKQTHG